MNVNDLSLSSLSSTSSSSSSSSSSSDDDNEMDWEEVVEFPSDQSDTSSDSIIIPVIAAVLMLQSQHVLITRMMLQQQAEAYIPRMNQTEYIRNHWPAIWARRSNDRKFERAIRMKRRSFLKLLSYLEPALLVNNDMANRRGGPVTPSFCLYLTIRYLTGDSCEMISNYVGISHTCFYHCLHKTLAAICSCPELDIVFPTTEEECENLAEGFESISKNAAIVNCVSVVDGYLLQITTPPKTKAKNVRSYFSGHYMRNGINIQACCDHNAAFTYFGLAAPGSANDRTAILESISGESLSAKIERLPKKFVVIGDAAYEPTEKLVPLFYGHQRDCRLHSNFNYAASSLRMRIEMAFGQMVSKFGILKRPLQNTLPRVTYIALAIARLHNFCVKERVYGMSVWERENQQQHFRYSASVPNANGLDERFPIPTRDEPRALYLNSGISSIRSRMAYRVRFVGIERPTSSVMHPDNLANHMT